MKFKEYIEYRCIAVSKLAERVNITARRLNHPSCPFNLTYVEVERLKAFVGDWDICEIPEEE